MSPAHRKGPASCIDEVGSSCVKVVMDPANIFKAGELPRMQDKLREAFDLLGNDIALAHAKDLDHDGEAGHLAAGEGLMDYPLYLSLLQHSGFDGTVVLHQMHHLSDAEIDSRFAYVEPAGTGRLPGVAAAGSAAGRTELEGHGVSQPREHVDVAIVGSGPAGCTYARLICDQLPDARVLLIEAGPVVSQPPGTHVNTITDPGARARAKVASQGPTQYSYNIPSAELQLLTHRLGA